MTWGYMSFSYKPLEKSQKEKFPNLKHRDSQMI